MDQGRQGRYVSGLGRGLNVAIYNTIGWGQGELGERISS